MYCKNCGNKLKEGGLFCDSCGIKIHEDDQIINKYALIQDYIGNNYNNLKTGFSWCTLLFGVVYLFYRKMWTFGLIIIAISTFSGIIFGEYASLLTFVANIVFAAIFKEQYYNNATKKVEEIINYYPSKTQEELSVICKKKGGTTIVPIILYILFLVVIFIISLILILGYMKTTKVNTTELEQQIQEKYDDIRNNINGIEEI